MNSSQSAKVDITFLAGRLVLSSRHAELVFVVLGTMSTVNASQSVAVSIPYVFGASAKAGHTV